MIKAIETHWKGYRFRSRLEARWAVFFETLGVDWQYEPEGFKTSEGPYLPDFFLPNVRKGLWVEIKPNVKDNAEETAERKLLDVVTHTGCDGTILKGDPWENAGEDLYLRPGVPDWSGSAIFGLMDDGGAGVYDCPYCFCTCPNCGKVGFEFDGRGARICWDECGDGARIDDFDYGTHPDKVYSANHPRILRAASAARAARFEHGESPVV